jgi:hypothetical protein
MEYSMFQRGTYNRLLVYMKPEEQTYIWLAECFHSEMLGFFQRYIYISQAQARPSLTEDMSQWLDTL